MVLGSLSTLRGQSDYATPYAFTTLAAVDATGSADGTGNAARFWQPYDVAVDSSGNVYVADCFNSTIRKITSGGVVTTLAGLAGTNGSPMARGAPLGFSTPKV